jgi:hypothetical protein
MTGSGREAKFSRIAIDRLLFDSAVVQEWILIDWIANDS